MKILMLLAALLVVAPVAAQAVLLPNGHFDTQSPVAQAPAIGPVGLTVGAGWSATTNVPPAFFWSTQGPATDGPFTFTSSYTTYLHVTDDFQGGDRFEIFDFGSSLGLTSAVPVDGSLTEIGPDAAFFDSGFSSGMFVLAPGAHSISINVVDNPFGGGRGYIQAAAAPIPEPGTLMLLGLGLAGAGAVNRRRKK